MKTISIAQLHALRALLPNLPGIKPTEIADYPKYYMTKNIRKSTHKSLESLGLIEAIPFADIKLWCPSKKGLAYLSNDETAWIDYAAVDIFKGIKPKTTAKNEMTLADVLNKRAKSKDGFVGVVTGIDFDDLSYDHAELDLSLNHPSTLKLHSSKRLTIESGDSVQCINWADLDLLEAA